MSCTNLEAFQSSGSRQMENKASFENLFIGTFFFVLMWGVYSRIHVTPFSKHPVCYVKGFVFLFCFINAAVFINGVKSKKNNCVKIN